MGCGAQGGGEFRGAWGNLKWGMQAARCLLGLQSPRLGSAWHPWLHAAHGWQDLAARLGRRTHFSMASMVFSSLSPDPVWGSAVGPWGWAPCSPLAPALSPRQPRWAASLLSSFHILPCHLLSYLRLPAS